MEAREQFEEFKRELSKLSDRGLVAKFNRETGISGWVSARGAYLAAIHEQFNARRFDYSEIGDAHSLSFKHRIQLYGKKIEIKNKKRREAVD